MRSFPTFDVGFCGRRWQLAYPSSELSPSADSARRHRRRFVADVAPHMGLVFFGRYALPSASYHPINRLGKRHSHTRTHTHTHTPTQRKRKCDPRWTRRPARSHSRHLSRRPPFCVPNQLYQLLLGFYWLLLAFFSFYRALTGFDSVLLGFYLILLGFTVFFLIFTGFQWFLLNFIGFYWVLLFFFGFLLDSDRYYWGYT